MKRLSGFVYAFFFCWKRKILVSGDKIGVEVVLELYF